jgi:arginine repressor
MKLEFVIKNLIQNNKIKTQSELGNILEKKGFSTTQSNISRILKKINTVKLIDENKETYYIVRSRPLEIVGWIKNLVTCIDNNGYTIVIKTYAGAANIIKQIIEERNMDNVLGAMADTNVVLVIPANIKAIGEITEKLRNTFSVEEKI